MLCVIDCKYAVRKTASYPDVLLQYNQVITGKQCLKKRYQKIALYFHKDLCNPPPANNVTIEQYKFTPGLQTVIELTPISLIPEHCNLLPHS